MTRESVPDFEAINNMLNALEVDIISNAPTDPAELAELAIAAKRLINRLKDYESHVHSLIAPHLEYGTQVQFQGGSLEKKTGTPRKSWDHSTLKSVVTEKIIKEAVDPETGAIDAPVSFLVNRAFDFVGIGYWKVGELKKIGVNPDRYCTTEPPNTNIITRLN